MYRVFLCVTLLAVSVAASNGRGFMGTREGENNTADLHVVAPEGGNVHISTSGNGTVFVNGEEVVTRKDLLVSSVPVGAFTWFHGDACPVGYLLCDGKQIPSKYPDLIALIGDTTPDMTTANRFIRAADGDALKTGQLQADTYKSHHHELKIGVVNDFNWGETQGSVHINEFPPADGEAGSRRAPVEPSGGTETRPKNIALLPCIKHDGGL